jgi:hypothetical protein
MELAPPEEESGWPACEPACEPAAAHLFVLVATDASGRPVKAVPAAEAARLEAAFAAAAECGPQVDAAEAAAPPFEDAAREDAGALAEHLTLAGEMLDAVSSAVAPHMQPSAAPPPAAPEVRRRAGVAPKCRLLRPL